MIKGEGETPRNARKGRPDILDAVGTWKRRTEEGINKAEAHVAEKIVKEAGAHVAEKIVKEAGAHVAEQITKEVEAHVMTEVAKPAEAHTKADLSIKAGAAAEQADQASEGMRAIQHSAELNQGTVTKEIQKQ